MKRALMRLGTALAIGLLVMACAPAPQGRQPAAVTRSRHRAPEASWEVLGSYSTRFDLRVAARSHNIRMAADRLDGSRIAPGGRWSFNQRVGRRTRGGGWELAPALVLEGLRLELGGGICQASSTVYNAALLADLTLKQRFPHTRPVRYVPLGRDATVSFGTKDLRLQNPHPFPVMIRARVVHDRLVVQVLGPRRLAYEVRLETADAEPATPRKELQMLAHPDRLAVGGVWIKLYRQRLRGGSVYETERIGRSSFYPFLRREALEAPQ